MPDRDADRLAGIVAECGCRGRVRESSPVAGGDINSAWRIVTDRDETLFIKLNTADYADMLSAEAEGLAALADTHCIRVPGPRATGVTDNAAWLACEYLNLGPPTAASDRRLGEALACLHETQADAFGWHRDNTIGLTHQPNPRETDWRTFFRGHRIGHQLRLAAEKGHGGSLQKKGEQLLGKMNSLLGDYHPPASLVHGDLWGGNRAALADGTPVIFDPACHYADPETDIAMTELFGRFDDGFYDAYTHHRPLDTGYHQIRRPLYQLYHILNHLNLFGGGFARSAESLIDELLGNS